MVMDVFFMGTAFLLGLLALLSGISVVQQAKIWRINTPTTVTAVEGSCVVVPCQTQPHSRVIWYQYHKMNYPVVYDGLNPRQVDYQFTGRTSVLGKASEGNCSLLIENVSRNDNQLKVYVWINPESDVGQRFYDKTVTILVERNTPSISVQTQIVEGETFLARCTIDCSCPHSPPSLHWQTSRFWENSTEKVFGGSPWGQWLLMETLRVVATYDMHNSKMSCSAQFNSFTTHSQQITLKVSYKPVSVTVVLEHEAVNEGGNVSVICTADSNPEPHTYSWLQRRVDQINTINSTQRRITLYSVSRDTSVSCTASNNVGAGQSEWLDLDVQYAPVILPETSCSQLSAVLRCVCQAEASPHASLYWMIDGNYTLPSSSVSNFTKKKQIVSAEISIPAESGMVVTCTAWNPFGNDTKQLSIENASNTSSLLIWLMLIGIALLLGFAFFIFRKYPRKSANPAIVIQDEGRSRDCRGFYSEAPQTPQREPERKTEEDRLSSVYENDFLQQMQADAKSNASTSYSAKDELSD